MTLPYTFELQKLESLSFISGLISKKKNSLSLVFFLKKNRMTVLLEEPFVSQILAYYTSNHAIQ